MGQKILLGKTEKIERGGLQQNFLYCKGDFQCFYVGFRQNFVLLLDRLVHLLGHKLPRIKGMPLGCMLTQIRHSIKIGQSTSTIHFQSLLHFWHTLEAKYEFSEGFLVIKFFLRGSFSPSLGQFFPCRVSFSVCGWARTGDHPSFSLRLQLLLSPTNTPSWAQPTLM